MNRKSFLIAWIVVLTLLIGVGSVAAQQDKPPARPDSPTTLGTAFTYQGELKKGTTPITGACNFHFSLWDAASGGTLINTQSLDNVPLTNGRFTVSLDFGVDAFSGNLRWLEIAVKCVSDTEFTTLIPRQALTAAPYALYSSGNWGLKGNSGTSANNFLGTTDNTTLTLGVNNAPAWRIVPASYYFWGALFSSPNIIGGSSSNVISATGTNGFTVIGATIGGGGASDGPNRVTGSFGTVSGGADNTAAGVAATVGGGASNKASNDYAAIGGGGQNVVSGTYATVSGGYQNIVSGAYGVVGGGYQNVISGTYTDHATIGGGEENIASQRYVTIGGGYHNTASTILATVSGGEYNIASGNHSIVGGGQGNTASGVYSTVPGGIGNTAAGYSSLAAGYYAQALHSGTFVWTDSAGADFSSTGNNQFLIRASGGVGINTNAPTRSLDVNGVIGVFDSGTRTYNGGVASELGGQLVEMGINDDAVNRFGGVYNSAAQGGLIRVDTRAGQNLFQFYGRGAGSTTLYPLATINNAGVLWLNGLGTGNPANPLCLDSLHQIATCTSSVRYKNNITNLNLGLDTIAQLRPVTFEWKSNGQPDLGFIAEEVNQVTPLLTTLGKDGQIEGVKYDRITAILVKGIQEQQQQIEALTAQNAAQQQEIAQLKRGTAQPDPSFNFFNAISVIALVGVVAIGLKQKRRARS